MVTLPESDGFSFKVEASTFLSALSKVNSIASATKVTAESERVFLCFASEKKLFVLSYTPDTFCYVRVEAQIKGEGFFAFDYETLTKTLKGRKELDVNIAKQIEVASGRYKVKLNIIDVPGNYLTAINHFLSKEKSVKMKSSDMEKIRAAIKQADIQDIYAGNKNCCYLMIKSGKMIVSSYDQFHMVQVKDKVGYPDTQVAFYSNTFRLLDKFIGAEDVSLSVGRHLRVESDSFVVCIPPVQVEQAQFTIVPEYLKELKSHESSFELNTAAVKALHNISGILDGDDKMTVKVGDGKVTLTINSKKGAISDSYKCKTDNTAEFTVDPRVLLDLYRKVTLPAQVNLYGKARGTSSVFTIFQDNIKMAGSYYVV